MLDSIRNLMAENSAVKSMFYKSCYEVRGRDFPEFLMNRDGFSLLVMGFTGMSVSSACNTVSVEQHAGDIVSAASDGIRQTLSQR